MNPKNIIRFPGGRNFSPRRLDVGFLLRYDLALLLILFALLRLGPVASMLALQLSVLTK